MGTDLSHPSIRVTASGCVYQSCPSCVRNIIPFIPLSITGSVVSAEVDKRVLVISRRPTSARMLAGVSSMWMSRLSGRHSVYRRQKSLEEELASMMRRADTLMWLMLAALCLSTELVIQTAAGTSSTTSAAELTVIPDNDEIWTTTTTALTAVESSVTGVGAARFCNQTISYTLNTDCKPCSINARFRCPDGLVQLTQVSSHIS